MIELIVSVLDTPVGPMSIYESSDYGSIDPELAKKVMLRCLLSFSLLEGPSSQLQQADAVLSFSEMERIGYCYVFQIPGKNPKGKNTCTIAYLLPATESGGLYQRVPILKPQISSIANHIMKEYQYEPDKKLSRSVQSALIQLSQGQQSLFSGSVPSLEKVQSQIIITRFTGSWQFLIKKYSKDKLDNVLFDLFIEKPIYIASDSRVMTELAIASLEYFCPQRTLKKLFLTDEIVDPLDIGADIISISSKMKNEIKNYIVIDLDKDKILNSSPKNVFKEFLRGFREDMPQFQVEARINQFVTNLQNNVSTLTELITKIPYDVQQLRDFDKKLQADEKEYALEMIVKRNPQLATTIKKKSGKSWLDDFQ